MTTRPFAHLLCFIGMFLTIFLWQPGSQVVSKKPDVSSAAAPAPAPAPAPARDKDKAKLGRLVVMVIDAWPDKARFDKALHPELHKLADQPYSHWVHVTSCAGNFTLPCLQTLLEGRESPFSSGLHNYTGHQGSGDSLPGIAAARGLKVANVSDQSLTSLYGKSAVRNIDCSTWTPDARLRDLKSVDEARKTLVEDKLDLLLYHIPGTDKLSHAVEYGTPRYMRHYKELDQKLTELFGELDFGRDAVFITGDHGHGHHGHHTRDTPGLFIGGPFQELIGALKSPPEKLLQEDILFFLSYVQMLPLPPDYEGAYFTELKADAPQRVRDYLELQRQNLASLGFPGDGLAAQALDFRRSQLARPWDEFKVTLPGLLCFLALLVALFSRPDLGWRWRLKVSVAAGLAAVSIVLLSTPERGLWLSILPGVALIATMLPRAGRRRAALMVVLLALAALLAYISIDWKDFFHVKDGGSWLHPLFYVALFLVGFPLSWLGWGRWGAAAMASCTFALFALPNGPYYYQSGTNMLQSFVRAALLLALVAWLTRGGRLAAARAALARPGAKLAALMLALATPWLFAQAAGGWVWQAFGEDYLNKMGPWPAGGIYFFFGALLLAGLPDRRRRIIFGVYWTIALAYVVCIAEITVANYVSSMAPIVVLLGWFLWRKARLAAAGRGKEDVLGSLGSIVVMAGICTSLWFLLRGYTVANADWGFAYKYLGWVRHDAAFFGLALVLCIPKYGFGMMGALVYIALHSTPRQVDRLFDHMLLFTMFKMAFYFTQVLFGSIRPGEKLHELAIPGVIYLSLFMPMIGTVFLIFLLTHKWRQRRSA